MSGDSEKTGWGLSRFIILGYAALGLLLLGLGVWGVTTRIAGAVVSSGIVAVQGNRQVVQHETGGVIAAINARDGDEVEAGEILVSLDARSSEPNSGSSRVNGTRSWRGRAAFPRSGTEWTASTSIPNWSRVLRFHRVPSGS